MWVLEHAQREVEIIKCRRPVSWGLIGQLTRPNATFEFALLSWLPRFAAPAVIQVAQTFFSVMHLDFSRVSEKPSMAT